jgi:hypothetical protein
VNNLENLCATEGDPNINIGVSFLPDLWVNLINLTDGTKRHKRKTTNILNPLKSLSQEQALAHEETVVEVQCA